MTNLRAFVNADDPEYKKYFWIGLDDRDRTNVYVWSSSMTTVIFVLKRFFSKVIFVQM
jgi:hypothetical protein